MPSSRKKEVIFSRGMRVCWNLKGRGQRDGEASGSTEAVGGSCQLHLHHAFSWRCISGHPVRCGCGTVLQRITIIDDTAYLLPLHQPASELGLATALPPIEEYISFDRPRQALLYRSPPADVQDPFRQLATASYQVLMIEEQAMIFRADLSCKPC